MATMTQLGSSPRLFAASVWVDNGGQNARPALVVLADALDGVGQWQAARAIRQEMRILEQETGLR